ncbi:MAG: AtpZ/AtpI family protein [Thermodesulfobacteriota bacterium]
MPREQKPHKEHLPEIVEKKYQKRQQARQEKQKPIFFGLGMFGTIGWTVAVPTVLGTFLGRWLDGLHLLDNRISWTLTGLFGGLFLGAVAAWGWVKKESGSR